MESMIAFHDDLRLGNSSWKLEQLAVDIYPGWHRTYIKGLEKQQLAGGGPSSEFGNWKLRRG